MELIATYWSDKFKINPSFYVSNKQRVDIKNIFHNNKKILKYLRIYLTRKIQVLGEYKVCWNT